MKNFDIGSRIYIQQFWIRIIQNLRIPIKIIQIPHQMIQIPRQNDPDTAYKVILILRQSGPDPASKRFRFYLV